jgi:hypothetical protein
MSSLLLVLFRHLDLDVWSLSAFELAPCHLLSGWYWAQPGEMRLRWLLLVMKQVDVTLSSIHAVSWI